LLGAVECPHLSVQIDRAAAIAHTVTQAQAVDVILLAGKGHEETQEIAGTKMPFSDIAHARAALDARASLREVQA
jgi:UDP-N-acetylmuramoyl-L-alanyl-D-glutamate--2,6-diaminopimelate ligase